MFAPIFLQNRKRKTMPPDLLRAVLPAVAKTPGEHAYAGAAAEVCALQTTLGENAAREMLRDLNELLESERRLDSQREGLDRAMNAQTLSAAQTERDVLRQKLETTQDDMARETVRQSMELSEARLTQITRLSPARERIEAQQEAIRQVMASVRTSLAGLAVASALSPSPEAGEGKTPPAALALRETAHQLQTRTRAVEQAVQEVVAMQAAGAR